MRVVHLVVLVLLGLCLSGCGDDKPVLMPDVTGKKLDAAYFGMEKAGLEDKDAVEVEGGGPFGVIVESNWTVCKQAPAAGKVMGEAPVLSVKRSCAKKPVKTTKPSTKAKPTASTTPRMPTILTTSNTPDLKALLESSAECSDAIGRFAEKYEGKTVRFDGHVADVAPHGDYDTRFDFLIFAGDFDPNSARGPSFQFRDKNYLNLGLTGPNIPDSVTAGQNYTFTADVGEFNGDNCLFQLTPVETTAR